MEAAVSLYRCIFTALLCFSSYALCCSPICECVGCMCYCTCFDQSLLVLGSLLFGIVSIFPWLLLLLYVFVLDCMLLPDISNSSFVQFQVRWLFGWLEVVGHALWTTLSNCHVLWCTPLSRSFLNFSSFLSTSQSYCIVCVQSLLWVLPKHCLY